MVSSDPLSVFLCLSVLLYVANGDYQCICNYNVETGVMPSPSAQGSPVGFLYEFDCKQNIEALNTAKWLAVAFEHKVGYVQINDDIQTQICPGEIPPGDIVTTTTTATASSTTTRLITTAAAAPTTMSSTPRTPSDQSTSTTQSATTRQPATTTQSTTTTKATTRQPTTTTQPTSTKQSPTTRESTTTRKLTTTTKPTTTIRPTTSMRPTTTTLKPMTIIYSKTTAQTARNLTTPMVVNVVSGKPKLCPAKLLSRVEYDRNILTQYGDHCYEVVSNQMDTWPNAEAYCSKFGGHLVSVGSSGEQIFITNFLKHNFYHEVWIGFNDRGSASQFLWSSGDKVIFTNWDPTSSGVMSTDNNLQNCVVLSPSDNGLWNNRKCQLSKSFICKYAINSPQTITRPGATQTTTTHLKSSTASTSLVSGKPSLCPSFMRNHANQAGSLLAQYGDKCYETVTTKELSWSQAERYCNRYGGHLITINNNMEQAYIYNFIKQNYRHTVWIGLTDSRKEGTFLWASGEKPVYLHWYNEPLGFLHLTDSYEDCAVLTIYHNGLWDDRDCYSTHNFICEYRLDGIPMVSTPAPTVPATNAYGISAPGDTSRCPSQVQSLVRRDSGKLGYYKNSCYEVIPNSKVSHDHAVQMCRERGGELVDILNSQEQSFVQSFLELYSPQHAVWIGLHDRNQENYFEWTSGAAAQYTHWIPGHTSNFVSHKQEDCVLIIPYKNGLWDDIPCGSSSYFFGDSGEIYPPLCEYRSQSLCARILKSHASFTGSLFTDYQNKCYEIPTTYHMDWDSASLYCRYFGGQLLTIDNHAEKTFILSYLKKTNKDSVWLTTGDKPGFSSPFGHFLHFFPWTQKTCSVLSVTGNEQSLRCSGQHYFVCEYGRGTQLSNAPTTPSAVSSAGISVPGNTSFCPSTIRAQAKRDNAYLGYFNSSCYEFITNKRETYNSALAMCHRRGGQLVDILGRQEQDFVQQFLVRYDPTNAVWIGLKDFTTGYFGRWVSGAPVQYTNWVANKQQNMYEKCSVILPYSNGQWDFTFCGYMGLFVTEQHPVLCEYKLQSYTGK